MGNKKMVVKCSEIGLVEDCIFEAVGETEDEMLFEIVEHSKEHGIKIEKGSPTERVLKRFIHVLLMPYKM